MKYVIGIIATLTLGAGIMLWINYPTAAKSAGKSKAFPELLDPSEIGELPDDGFVQTKDKPSQFGADRVKGDSKPVAFDGKRAMTYLQSICDLGPRISGSRQMKEQQKLIKKHFEDLGAKVTFQTFMAKQNNVKGEVEMTNIIVSFLPEKKRRVILCSHYDTRPIADQEPNPRDWQLPFVSANDGGSGVALLMEMGNHMKDLKTNVGVDFVIFDGEEFIYVTEGAKADRYFIGSEYFANDWYKTKGRCDYSAAILLDMIAGKNLFLPVETNSLRRARPLCEEVYSIAREQNARSFAWKQGHEVRDDHLSLLRVGIPAIDLIDFDYPHWHKLSDTPKNCSAASFEQVAGVLSVWLQRTK